MSTENEHNTQPFWKYKRTWFAGIALGVVGGFFWLVQSAFLMNFLITTIEKQTASVLDAEISIERLHGNVLRGITAEGIQLRDKNEETLLTLDTLRLRYQLLSLVRSEFLIHEIHLSKPAVFLEQDSDSLWNLLGILPPGEDAEKDKKTDESQGNPFPFRIADLQIRGGEVSLRSHVLLPDTTIRADHIHLRSMVALGKQDLELQLDEFRVTLHEARLSAPLQFASRAQIMDGEFTLEQLVLSSGASLLESSGFFNLTTDDLTFDTHVKPLSRADLAAYLTDLPLQQNLSISLGVRGNLSDMTVSVQAQAPGLQNFHASAGVSVQPEPELRSFSVSFDILDLPLLTGLEETPKMTDFRTEGNGALAFSEPEQGNITMHMHLSELVLAPYEVQHLRFDARLNQQRLSSSAQWATGNQNFRLAANAHHLFDELPNWDVTFSGRNINPGYWAQQEELDGSFHLTAQLIGSGFDPENARVAYDIAVNDLRLPVQNLAEITLQGSATAAKLSSEFGLTISDSQIFGSLTADIATDEPRYSFQITSPDLNLAEIQGLEELPTRIRFAFAGEGRGFDPENLEFNAELNADSSFVNRAFISELKTTIQITDQVLRLSDTRLRSDISDARLEARFNLGEVRHPDNYFNFDLELKDLSPFTSLAGLEHLQAFGNLTGQIHPVGDDRLEITSTLQLHDVRIDTLSLPSISGKAHAALSDSVHFAVSLDVDAPGVPQFTAHALRFQAQGNHSDSTLVTDFDMTFLVRENSGISHNAQLRITPDSLQLLTKAFSLFDPVGRYSLEEPFQVTLANELVRVDTLRLHSENGSTIVLAAEQFGPEAFRGYFDGSDADLGLIQQLVWEEPLFEALFSGRIAFELDGMEHIMVQSNFVMHQFNMDGFRLDSLSLNASIADEWLDMAISMRKSGENLLTAHYVLPFQPGSPEDFDPAFFEEAVSGYLRIPERNLDEIAPLLNMFGLEGITGKISVDSQLEGTAGSPEFFTRFAYYDGTLSEVPVDSLSVVLSYSEEQSKMLVEGFMKSVGAEVLRFNGNVPLFVDFQRFSVQGPDSDHPIDIRFVTNEFRLATLNQFVPEDVIRGLRGILTADVSLTGPPENLVLTGFTRLRNGSVRVVENNIRFQNIRMDMIFEPGKVILENLAMESSGSFRSSGHITLNGFQPGEMDFRFQARNFRIFDTRDIDLFVSMDTRLRGELESLQLDGDFSVERGMVYLDNFGERTIEDVQLDEERRTESAELPDIFTPLAMELNFSISRNFFLRNRRDPELNLDVRGNLDIVKRTGEEDIQVFGDLNIPSGHASTLFNKRFEMESGSILFSGPATNPELHIRTMYRPRQTGEDIRIYYIITGTVEEPEFHYESEPQMGFQDIISYTLFGRPFAALSGWERSVSGRSQSDIAADIALDLIIDRVEQLASDRLGIDVVEIDNSQKGTTIKAGKYLTDRIFVAYLQELGGSALGRQVVIEYLLTNNLDLIITASEDYRSGVDLLWRFDY